MKIIVNKDFRKFKEGDTIELNVEPNKVVCLVGDNGSGKSTICRGIRGMKDSLKNINKSMYDGMSSFINDVNKIDFGVNCTIEGLDDYDEVFCLDRISDDPLSYDNCATASSLILGGGMKMQKASGGEKSVMMFSKYLDQIKKTHKQGNKALFVLDEIDSGFDMKFQNNYILATYKLISKMCKNPALLIVTHNPLALLSKHNKKLNLVVYDLDKKLEYDDVEEWFYNKTGLRIVKA